MELITLLGDIDENFYQLGLKDKENGKIVHNDVRRMLKTPWKHVNIAVEEIGKAILKNSLLSKTDYYRHLKSYAEGMDCSIEECAYVMAIPEIVSCMSKWAPNFIRSTFGCSSLFTKNENNQLIHGRILDFPLQGSFDQFERGILYDLKGMPKIFGLGTSGIPYPSITLMTEDGLTLALHQKFTNIFNKNGVSIFELVFDLIKNANDKKSILEYLSHHQSLTTWALYIGFKNGDVLACDLMGENIIYSEHQVEKNSFLYFCNHLVDENINQEQFLPFGFNQYNLMRENVAKKKLEKLSSNLEQIKSMDEEILKLLSTPLEQINKKKNNYQDFNLDTLTPSSISSMVLNPSAKKIQYIEGEAPKLYCPSSHIEIINCFHRPEKKSLYKKSKKNSEYLEYHQGLQSLMKAQSGFDLKDPQIIYHELQFAIDHLEKRQEKGIAEFYFLVAQYMYETHPKTLNHILHDFKKLEDKLPKYLNDHCLLFIGRLERILNLPITVEEDKITNNNLKKTFSIEMKIPSGILHITTRNMLFPRIDILDIIHVM